MMEPYKLVWSVVFGVSRGLYVFAGSFIAAALYRYVAEERIMMTTAMFVGLITAGFASGPQKLAAMAINQPNVEVLSWTIAALFAIPARTYGDALGKRLLEARLSSMKPTTKVYRLPEDPDNIEDVPGEPPAPREVKERIAGREYEFPRGTPREDVERVIKRDLEEEGGVGRAVVRIDGNEVKVRLAGAKPPVSHTLPPDKVAVSVEPKGGSAHIGEGDRVIVYADGRKLCEAEVWKRSESGVVLVVNREHADELMRLITKGKDVSLVVEPTEK